MKLLNYTPHSITVCNIAGTEIIRTIPSSGVARVSSENRSGDPIDGVPFSETILGDVTGLPDPQPDTMYIVSDFVVRALPNRDDLVRPDTGPSCVRKDGQIWAVRGLTR
jgi:hypothetical protein